MIALQILLQLHRIDNLEHLPRYHPLIPTISGLVPVIIETLVLVVIPVLVSASALVRSSQPDDVGVLALAG